MASSRRQTLVAAAGFVLLALAVFRPTPGELATTAPAYHGNATDALLLMWATSHVSTTLFADPLHLFDAPIFHPARGTLAYGDHMIGQALAGLPIWLATRNPLLEYNLLALASYVLGATAMFCYARAVTGDAGAAAVGGIAFAFTPFRFQSPLWLQVLCTWFMPLALWSWLRFVATRRPRDWALWVGAWTAHSLMGLYLALYFGLVMAALALAGLVAAPRCRRLWAGTLGAPLAVAALLAPTIVPYLALRGQGQVRHTVLETPLAFLLPGPGTLTGWATGLAGPARFGPGLVVVALALVGLARGRGVQAPSMPAPSFVRRVHALGLALSLGLVLVPARVQLALPGLDMLRNTDRALFVALLFAAALVAAGAATVRARLTPRAGLAACVVVALVAADVGSAPRERKPMPVGDAVPPAYGWLAALPPHTVVAEGPLAGDGAARAMYFQIVHRHPMPTGYSGFVAPAGLWVNLRIAHFPQPDVLRVLGALDVADVLWHFPSAARADAMFARPPPGVLPAARFGTDVVFRLTPLPPAPAPVLRPLPAASLLVRASSDAAPPAALGPGDAGTPWRLDVRSGDAAPVVTVELDRPHAVAGVRCPPVEPDAPGTYLSDVETSVDGTTWEPVDASLVPSDVAVFVRDPRALDAFVATFPARVAQAVRLVNRELAFWGGPWEMKGLQVLVDCRADPIPGCPGP